ncbi:hypothetical protein [Streptomyces sp. NPDC056061]|uniref:hypothetical protein n=1 Tax=Streptomyces sp. NPDC056061 TaxID=3345700 RepID=UPI0035DFD2D1
MTALTASATAADLLTLTLNVSDDQETWHRIVFEGESPAYLDKQAAAWITERPYLAVEMDEASTCFDQFPRTFDAVFAPSTKALWVFAKRF